MSNDYHEMGPIDYLIVEYPAGRMTGEGLPMLLDLVDRGIIRILDLQFIRRLADGSIVHIEVNGPAALDDADLSIFQGVTSGLLDQGDLEAAAETIEPGSAAGGCAHPSPSDPRSTRRNRGCILGFRRTGGERCLAFLEVLRELRLLQARRRSPPSKTKTRTSRKEHKDATCRTSYAPPRRDRAGPRSPHRGHRGYSSRGSPRSEPPRGSP